MNATIWTSLTELCKHLGREGKAIVDETEKGWFIQYIDRDPRLLAKQAAADQRKVVELDEEERMRRVIEAQIAAATATATTTASSFNCSGGDDADDSNADLMRLEGASKIEVSFAAKKRPFKMASTGSSVAIFNNTANPSNAISDSNVPSSSSSSSRERDEPPAKRISSSSSSGAQQPMSAIEQLVREEQGRKQQLATQQAQRCSVEQDGRSEAIPVDIRKDHWLVTGITVKCMSKTLSSGKYYKKKGTVINVHDRYVAEVKMDDGGDGGTGGGARIRIDQNELETVIPKVGRPCLILNGRGRGSRATLIRINEEQYNCDVKLDDGQELSGVDYEDISKVVEE
jgi:DNA/RNA-binding protein KIN17